MTAAAPATAAPSEGAHPGGGLLSFCLEAVHALRIELGFVLLFGCMWIFNRFLSPKAADHKVGAAARKGQPRFFPEPRGQTAPGLTRRRAPPAQGAQGPAAGSLGAAAAGHDAAAVLAVETCHPTPAQLRDPAWVSAAVQQLCRSQVQRALELYREALRVGLDLHGLPPADGAQLFMNLVTSAIRVGQTEEAQGLLRDCRERGPGVSQALLSSATKLCTSKQFFKECLSIFDYVAEDQSLQVEDRSVWSCLLFCAVEARAYHRCTFLFGRLKSFGLPSNKDFGNMIRCASSQGDWRLALKLIREMRDAGVEVDSVVYNTALATCVAACQTDQARSLLEDMEAIDGVADVITYNTLAKGYAKAGRMEQCFELYEHMRARKIAPSQVTYGILLDCCINEKQMDRAAEVFNNMTKEGCVMNTVLYTTLIKGFARAEQVDQAMKVYQQMRADRERGVTPDLITFSILIKANCDAGRLNVALGLLDAMVELNLCPDEVVFNNLLGGCVREANGELAKRLYQGMVQGGIQPSNATFSILIRLYAQCKLLDEAVEMLRTEPAVRGVEAEPRLYMQLAQACLRERQGRRAVEVYRLLVQASQPTAAMHGSLLGMCAKLNMLDTGAEILALAAEAGARVDARDAAQLREAALRKRKAPCANAMATSMARLGIAAC